MGRGTTARARARRTPSCRSGAGDFARLFWDYPARSIRTDADRDLVVRRVIAEGGWREMSLLRSRIGDQAIRDVIERTDARGLSSQRIRFWELVLGLPARKANAWVRRAQESTWARRARRHRRSVDFDWFREDPIDDPLRLAADLRTPDFRFETDRVEKGTLHGRAGGVRVSFLEYGYPLLGGLRESEGVRLASLEDIAARCCFSACRGRT